MSTPQPEPVPPELVRKVIFAGAVLGPERVRAELVRILLAAIANRAARDPDATGSPRAAP